MSSGPDKSWPADDHETASDVSTVAIWLVRALPAPEGLRPDKDSMSAHHDGSRLVVRRSCAGDLPRRDHGAMLAVTPKSRMVIRRARRFSLPPMSHRCAVYTGASGHSAGQGAGPSWPVGNIAEHATRIQRASCGGERRAAVHSET